MKCRMCDKEIKIGFKRKIFCSKKCSDLFYGYKTDRKTNCVICGKPLTGRQRSYCSDECKRKGKIEREIKEHKYEYKKPQAEEVKCEPKKRGRPKKKLSISEVNELARAEGLNYGQYVSKYGL